MQRNAEKFRDMQRNAKKCKEMQRNSEKCKEMHICRDILMTFMPHGNVIFDILEPLHLVNIAHVGSYRNLKNHVETSKKNAFLGKLSQIFEPTHQPQGFCEIWEHKR